MTADLSFLGTGWAFPPSFSRGGAGVAMVSGIDDIHESLRILLTTARGERVMVEDFGCDLREFQFEEMSQSLVNGIRAMVSDAVLLHETRIILDRLNVTPSADDPGLLLVALDYTVASTNSRFNMVFPFYLKEANGPGL